MLNDGNGRPRLEVVLDQLRRRVCLSPIGEELRLHENALAAEFEMSRTPIRQALQRLAYERLVETRSGVGTISTPMREADRPRDQRTHNGLIRAMLEHDLAAPTLLDRSSIAALGAAVRETPQIDRDVAFDARAALLACLRRFAPDPILHDAFEASHWRVIRWAMSDFVADPRQGGADVRALVEAVEHAAKDGPQNVLFALLGRP